MLQLSACVIAKNEEKNLLGWLNCMKKIVNEIIVVDTGSTDRTVEVAETAGAKVYLFEWKDDFSAAKNFAIDKATGDWILFLDADEYFTEDTVHNVSNRIAALHKNKNIDAMLCRLVNVDVDKENSCISVIQSLRIFRKNAALRFKGRVHEFLYRANGPLRVAQASTDIEIYHTGYSGSIIENKLKRNLDLLLEERDKFGENPAHYPYFADCYYGLKNYEKAIYYAERAISQKIVAIGQESTIYRRLIDSMALSGRDTNDILLIIQTAIDKFPWMPEFLWNKGEVFFQQKKYIEAEKMLKKALDLYNHPNRSLPCGEIFIGQVNLVYCRLAEIAILKNDILQALELYVKSLQFYRYNEIALQGLFQQLLYENPVDILELLKTIYDDSKRDLEFLTRSLQRWPNNKVYIYYMMQLVEKYHMATKKNSVAAFCAAENNEAGLNLAVQEIEEAYKFMIMCLLFQCEENQYMTAQVLLPQIYINVLNKCMGKIVDLSKAENRLYDDIKIEAGKIRDIKGNPYFSVGQEFEN